MEQNPERNLRFHSTSAWFNYYSIQSQVGLLWTSHRRVHRDTNRSPRLRRTFLALEK